MRIVTNLLVLGLISLTLASCSALPSEFTSENIMKVHQGMSSDEILTLFGEPKSIEVTTCGPFLGKWNCTIWSYGDYPYDHASFYFRGEHDSLILNNFDIDRDYNEWD